MTRRHLSSVPDVPASVEPYAFAARTYFRSGWSPLPLPEGQKTYPPTGYTGGKGRPAESSTVEYWVKTKPRGNIAIRMPKGLIGIDVDAYSGKDGAATLAAAEERWGPLPPTWRSTSRRDGVSGIRLYRIPEGLSWPGQLPGGGVELCRWDHRYVIVFPSIHDETGQQYQWYTPGGQCATEDATSEGNDWEFPELEDLSALPESWVTGLTSGKTWEERAEEDLDPEEVAQWIKDRPEGSMCEKMTRTLDGWMTRISAAGEDGGAHDAARDAAWAVLRDAAQGHSGVQSALRRIMLAHKEALRTRRPEKAAGEWASIKARGVRKVAAEGPTDNDDPCVLGETSRPAAKRNRGSEGMDYERDDIGNGQRFALQWRDAVRWVPFADSWYIWKGQIWEPDGDGEIVRMATKTVRAMASEAESIEDPKEKSAFLKFVRASSNETRLNAMLRMSKSQKGITIPGERFDADPSQIVCANGTLELPLEFSGAGIRRVPSIQEHHNTISTGVEYSASSLGSSPDWEKFLAKFQPDVEVRDWLQKLAGYSLLGSNPRRLMVVTMGETSTGKSTFAEAIGGALGRYAGSTSMTIFRDNQDERARPDLLRVLTKRFVYAEEASRSWHLHPDQIKRITGGTHIQARTLHKGVYLDIVPRFTPWLVTNNPPTIEGADAALRRRILVVPFDVQIPKTEEDAGFREKLDAPGGRAAILAWLVAGYEAYLADPDSLQVVPLGAVESNLRFWNEISDASVCLFDMCEFDAEYVISPMDLYKGYQAWCTENGVAARDVMSSTKFGREVADAYPKRMMKVESKPVRMRTGLRLKESWARLVS